jgi:hypothetical protein
VNPCPNEFVQAGVANLLSSPQAKGERRRAVAEGDNNKKRIANSGLLLAKNIS